METERIMLCLRHRKMTSMTGVRRKVVESETWEVTRARPQEALAL